MAVGIILAGGRGTRLGHEKVSLVLGGTPLLQRVVASVSAATDRVLVVKAAGQALPPVHGKFTAAEDIFPSLGPAGGLYTGLKSTEAQSTCVVGCDMPFLDPELLRHLVSMLPGYDAVVPRLDGKTHVLHAAYARTCLSAAEEVLMRNRPSLRAILAKVRVRYLEQHELEDLERWRRSCFNLNAPADLELANRWISLCTR
ncbi:MAG: molybdenum cofactor guanylyltransferase [Chloroflexi bacterium]|nr:molybdenum cofactor guanylyltransferase [Chloroflexota bacterium]